jgi:GAF domain-containing protein
MSSHAGSTSTGTNHEAHTAQEAGREAVVTTVSAERLARTFVEVADTLVNEFDLIEFLQMLAHRTASLIDASAVGLLLANQRGRLEFMAASDENTKLLELFQVQTSEGPCLDAFQTATPVINADLATAVTRWPRFAPRATAAGFRSVHAFPLRLRADVIGALNVFGSEPGRSLDEADVPVVQALADIAAIGLLQERAIRRGELLTEQLQGALNSRIIIEQAKGAIAQARNVSVDDAFGMLRAHARMTNQRLVDLAHAVVTEPERVADLTKP